MNRYPAISVVMPVYNTGQYVGEAIERILSQTFTDFEFIIVNDGSTDNSLEVISSFKDKRIKIIHYETNAGNYPARNKGNAVARGKYICVMDSDDISTPQRLEKQSSYMEENPEVGISGGGFRIYGREEDLFFRETGYEEIKVMLLRSFCFYHTAMIFRRNLFLKYGLNYNENYPLAADYDLAVRGARYFPVTNIPEDLFHYRIHDDQNSWKFRNRQNEVIAKIRLDQLRYLGIQPDGHELKLHFHLLNRVPLEFKESNVVIRWIEKVMDANRNKKYYQHDNLKLFFDSLLACQPYLKIRSDMVLPFVEARKKGTRSDLSDVTFLIILRIDSNEKIENTNAVVKYLEQSFRTTVSVIEADNVCYYKPEHSTRGIRYEFVHDVNENLLMNKLILNELPGIATKYFSVWDPCIIVPTEQVLKGVATLRMGNAALCLPYDGRIFFCDRMTSILYRYSLNIDLLHKQQTALELFDGWNSCGGAFIAEKKAYLKIITGNEKIVDQKIADSERIKRMEVAGQTVSRIKGPAYRLWHPVWDNMINKSTEAEINGRKEFLRTCSMVINQ